jgi:hypothetical protein
MGNTEPARWDDYVLAGLLLLISVPRVALGLLSNRPLGAEDTLAMVMVLLAIVVVAWRRS